MKKQILPKAVELEVFRRSVNRKLWLAMGLLTTVTLSLAALSFVAMARPIPVVAFDERGRPMLFEDTVSPRLRMEDVRIDYFTEAFLSRWALVDSANVVEDFTAALNMMTPTYRRVVASDEEELARRRKRQDLNMKSRFSSFEIKIGTYDAEDVDGKIYVLAHGTMTFLPKFGGSEDQEVTRYFVSEVVLQRVPVTKVSIHGLLVDQANTRMFDSEAELKADVARQRK